MVDALELLLVDVWLNHGWTLVIVIGFCGFTQSLLVLGSFFELYSKSLLFGLSTRMSLDFIVRGADSIIQENPQKVKVIFPFIII
jgi:hypothetical protein